MNYMQYHEDEGHARETLKCINDLRKEQKLCDVIISVDGQEIPAHRVVLAANSSYFKAMFTGQMEEAHQRVVTMHGVSPSALQMLIDYCYTSSMQVDADNVQSLLPVACLLQMDSIKFACSDFLKRNLDWSNCLGIQAFAEAHDCTDLKEAADSFALQHYMEIRDGDEFLELTTEELSKLVANDELNAKGEELVFQSVMSWIKHRPEERASKLDQILNHVRLPLMDPQYLVSVVGADPLIKSNDKCRDLVDEAKDYLLLPDQRASKQSIRTRPRNPTKCDEVLFAVGGWCSGNAISMVERYNPRLDEWKVVATMTKRRCGVGVTVLGDFLYAIGGHDGTSYLNSIERYDPKTNQWSSNIAPTNTCRTSVGVATLENLIYAVGGQDGVSCLSIVERYDPKSNRWNTIANMNARRLGVAVAVLNNQLYVVGGSDGTTPLNSVERYDPKMNRWSPVEPMKTKRKHLGTAVLDNLLYAIGGRDENTELNSVEKYDPVTNQWSSVVAMNFRRSGVGLAVVNGHLYAVGGFDGSNYLKSVEWFDQSTNQWKIAGSMNYRRLGGGVGVLKLPETA